MENQLKALRSERGMTLVKLAQLSGYGKSTINNFENGRAPASRDFLEKIAEILGVEPDDILRPTDYRRDALEELNKLGRHYPESDDLHALLETIITRPNYCANERPFLLTLWEELFHVKERIAKLRKPK